MLSAIIDGITGLVKLAIDLAAEAAQAKAEAHQAILDRVNNAKASLAGDKTDAHQAIEADLAATQAELDELKAQHAVKP